MSQIDNSAMLARFLEYVQIDSETGFEKEMADRLVVDLTAIGCTVTTDDIAEVANTTGYNVYATLEGDASLEPMLFAAHMDTVIPGKGVKPQVCEDGYVRSDGTTVLGGDDKAGIVAILAALEAVRDEHHRTVEAIFTVREESGMGGSLNLDYSRIQSKMGVALDSGGGPSKLITAAPGQNKIKATIIGRKAHAGVAPEQGISAIQVAAHAVAAMELLRIDFETTCNIGVFKAEGPTNIVPETVELVMEVRSRSTEKLNAHTAHVISCMEAACEKFGARVEHSVATSYLGYTLDESHPLVSCVVEAGKAAGLSPVCVSSGGGSDANVFNHNGIAALNIGVGMEKVHTTAEQQSIADMETAAQVCKNLMLG